MMSLRSVALLGGAFLLAMSACTADRTGSDQSTTAASAVSTTGRAQAPAASGTQQGLDRSPTSTAQRLPIGTPQAGTQIQVAPQPGAAPGFDGVGTVTVAVGGAAIFAGPAGDPYARVREGVVLAGIGEAPDAAGWIAVRTPCDDVAYVNASEVYAEPPRAAPDVGAGFDFSQAVLVIDPGHGGANRGAPSPDGSLVEKDVNVDIALRTRDLLLASHDVDWATGDIYPGEDIPAAARVIITRSGDVAEADYEAGLVFRAELAGVVAAHAMVSIHNNAGFDAEVAAPGSDVYYQSQLPDSRRLAALLVEEFQTSFGSFEADWVATLPVGAKSRLSPSDGTSQYYGLLRRAEVPTVIAEGAYIANQSEAELLATPEFRQAYAGAVYRALVRFAMGDDSGGPSFDPVVWDGEAGSGAPRPDCVLPVQEPG